MTKNTASGDSNWQLIDPNCMSTTVNKKSIKANKQVVKRLSTLNFSPHSMNDFIFIFSNNVNN
jgi:hypothetical protein